MTIGTLHIARIACSLLLLSGMVSAQTRDDTLYESIVAGNVDLLSERLSSGLSPDAEILVPNAELQVSLFQLAVRAANDDAVAKLLLLGATATDIESQLGDIPLLTAMAQQGLLKSLNITLERDPVALVQAGGSPFLAAINFEQVEVAYVLLSAMERLMAQHEVRAILNQALPLAVSIEDPELVPTLLASGADVNASSALIAAVGFCSSRNVELFLTSGADPNGTYRGRHVAHYSGRCLDPPWEDTAVVRTIIGLLHDHGSNVCRAMQDGAEPDDVRSTVLGQIVRDIAQCR